MKFINIENKRISIDAITKYSGPFPINENELKFANGKSWYICIHTLDGTYSNFYYTSKDAANAILDKIDYIIGINSIIII